MAQPFVLIVDDEKDFPEIIGTKLKAAGFDTAYAKNKEEAFKTAEARLPNLILMDINMPNEQGPELLLDFKQNEKTKSVKVAFLTSFKDPWPAIAGAPPDVAHEIGAADFLQKTEDLDVLVKKIKSLSGAGVVSEPVANVARKAPSKSGDVHVSVVKHASKK